MPRQLETHRLACPTFLYPWFPNQGLRNHGAAARSHPSVWFIAPHCTRDGRGLGNRSRKPFLLAASQELGLDVQVTRGSCKERFEPSKPRNALQRERLDGLERWEGSIRCTRKAGGSAPSPGRESKLSLR